ncbi:hypothetical protein niasHT_032896 [Heterodera trifolii]|uniref:Uncharacterized protein n=1 Tax=Heterodera trifolii TaxID=157864 RepID=A0ABD2J4J5_9BILA
MSDRRKEAEEKMAKTIFISSDCWLCVFDLLSPRQLGLGISMISHRFDYYVDEHFEHIVICYIDQNVIAFLHRFRQLFASFCPINLYISTASNDRILEFILHNIWPMIGKNICGMYFSANVFRRLRKFVPSILNDYPSLRVVSTNFDYFFAEFPADDSAMASNAQAVAKWLFTPRPDNVPKVLKCLFHPDDGNWSLKMESFQAAFANASSPVNFIVVLWFNLKPFAASVVPFDQTNELTREQLALKLTDYCNCFLLIRCPIARDADKWTKWEKEAIGWKIYDQWNRINIKIDGEEDIGDGLLDATPGQSDQ